MPKPSLGLAILCLAGVLGALDSAFNYFYRPSGVSHTGGAMLVIGSCLLIVGACVLLAALPNRGWLRAALVALLPLGLIGTGFAAYLLEADLLVGLMSIGLLGWCADRVPARRSKAAAVPLQRGLVR